MIPSRLALRLIPVALATFQVLGPVGPSASLAAQSPAAVTVGQDSPASIPSVRAGMSPFPRLTSPLESRLAVTPASASPPPGTMVYYAQPGESLRVVAAHFGIHYSQVRSPGPLPIAGLLNPGQALYLPAHLKDLLAGELLLPDSEVVYSPSTIDFEVAAYLKQASGFLNTHREFLRSTGWTSAAEIIQRVALENSINPRLLLALLEYECHCVLGQPEAGIVLSALLGNTDFRHKGLYRQLDWAAGRLSVGYYGWRAGTLGEVLLADGNAVRIAPDLNAGSAALMYFFAYRYGGTAWRQAVDAKTGLPALYARMFGDPWGLARRAGPLFPPGMRLPELILPFETDRLWSYTSGPHAVWGADGAQAALDFAPATHWSGCIDTKAWAVAVADGVVVRADFGYVIQDLDDGALLSDGLEQTGWAILYMHIASQDRVEPGAYLRAGDPLGHPSCEGGRATGTHLHLARKYNGEWIAADGPLPFILSGWRAHAGGNPFQGTLTKDGKTVVAHPYGSFETNILRSGTGH